MTIDRANGMGQDTLHPGGNTGLMMPGGSPGRNGPTDYDGLSYELPVSQTFNFMIYYHLFQKKIAMFGGKNMRFAFLILGDFNSKTDNAAIHNGDAQIIGVSSIQEACTAAEKLCEAGVGCIELCGAFGRDGAKKVIEATGNKIPVGYITHLPEQDSVYRAAFSK